MELTIIKGVSGSGKSFTARCMTLTKPHLEVEPFQLWGLPKRSYAGMYALIIDGVTSADCKHVAEFVSKIKSKRLKVIVCVQSDFMPLLDLDCDITIKTARFQS